MPCSTYSISSMQDFTDLADMLNRRKDLGLSEDGELGYEQQVREILSNVKRNGLGALLEYTRNFDCSSFREDQLCISASEIAQAASSIDQQDMEILYEAAGNIRSFHEAQKTNSWFTTRADGSIMGQVIKPMRRAGLYVPGGREGETPLISSLLMTAIPALVAGVPEVAVVTPPRKDGTVNPYILAVAHMLGIKEVYAVGSAWAVAALAYGAGPIAPVDIISGPGNIWVSTAKRLLIGQVGIDMIAGPSEVVILADKNANPSWVAADLLSQAEHDHLASSICVTTSAEMAEAVAAELALQCPTLPRAELAASSLKQWGALVVAANMDLAVDIVNKIAPEHLEIMCDNPWDLLPGIDKAGAIFLGKSSAEAIGDYFAGPNHVLPTMGTARFSSALGVDTFCTKSSIISASAKFAAQGASAIARMARLEGLEAHARSAEKRGKQ